jgi:DNA (cytosine-5)-methyltransferase 1
MTFRIGSLFSGIGGLELGLERATGGHVVWQVERDAWCRRVLAKHWPKAERFDDVCTVGAASLAPVDVICGGFPCQDISFAGKGAGLDGERSGLWYEYARIVRELRPRIVVVENVAALLVRGLDAVLGTLASLGYDAAWDCVPAASVGAPHRRDRLFVVAWRNLADAGLHGRDGDAERDGGTVGGRKAVLEGRDALGSR